MIGPGSLASKGADRVDPGPTFDRCPECCQRNRAERGGSRQPCGRPAGGEPEHVAVEQADSGEGEQSAGGESRRDREETRAQHEAADAAWIGAERYADADFVGTAGDDLTQDAVEADRGKQQGEDCERRDEGGGESFASEAVTEFVRFAGGRDERVGFDIADEGTQRIEQGVFTVACSRDIAM